MQIKNLPERAQAWVREFHTRNPDIGKPPPGTGFDGQGEIGFQNLYVAEWAAWCFGRIAEEMAVLHRRQTQWADRLTKIEARLDALDQATNFGNETKGE